MKLAAKQLPEGYPVDKHFNPRYNPWKERLCVVPDGDLFKAISDGKAGVVTGQIKAFNQAGISMEEGTQIDADIIVLATGLKMQLLGGASISVDGQPFAIADSMVYKGMMISGLPNFTYSFGYTNASWTLKVDLTANYLCKLIQYMDDHHFKNVRPVAPSNLSKTDFLDLSSGYIKRAESLLPKNGTKKPWRVYQNYIMDMLNIRVSKVRNKYLSFR